MFPSDFIKRLEHQAYIDKDDLLSALKEPSPTSIRINSLKLDLRPVNSTPVPWCKTGFYLEKRPPFTADPFFNAGCYYPQEASGMFLEQVFSLGIIPEGNIRILDLCAAPGGKSTHLSSLIADNGLLVANEVIKSRASILAENITRWGIPNTIVSQNDPLEAGRLKGFFDVILVDAPCSGEGMFRNPDAVNEWSEENAFHCSERQKRILMDVWPALKEGGIMIYSTCTFNPAENEENIKWLLNKQEAESVELDISDFSGIKRIDYQGITGYGFYPGKINGEGLFLSVLRKTAQQEKTLRKIYNRVTHKAGKDEMKAALSWTDFKEEQVIRSGDDLIHIPCSIDEFEFLSGQLRIVKPGTRICTVKNRDILPSHDLALSTSLKKGAFSIADLDYNQAVAFLKRGNLIVRNAREGWFISAYNGMNLGFAKNIGNRINNYYPVGWRIRMEIPASFSDELIKWES
jgi:NOL1/NOP2/sun family putative RNA methylase